MIKIKLILVSLLTALWTYAFPSFAQEWVAINDDTNSEQYFYDNNGWIEQWRFGELEPDQMGASIMVNIPGQSAMTFGLSEVYDVVFDCNLPRMIYLSSTWFSEFMGEGEITKVFEEISGWNPIRYKKELMIRELVCSWIRPIN